jgi:hypothetical protein
MKVLYVGGIAAIGGIITMIFGSFWIGLILVLAGLIAVGRWRAMHHDGKSLRERERERLENRYRNPGGPPGPPPPPSTGPPVGGG